MIIVGENPENRKNPKMVSDKKVGISSTIVNNSWDLSNSDSTSGDNINDISYNDSQNETVFTTATHLMNSGLDEIPTLIHPFLPKVGISGVVGSSDTGKSTFLRQLAFHVAYGYQTFLSFGINAKYRRAIYVSTEDDEHAISVLLRKQFGNPNQPEKTDRLKFIFNTDNLYQKLDAEMTLNPVDLVVIDAFSDLYGNDMNANNKVRNYLNKYLNLAKKHQCSIIFLHHTGKRTDSLIPGKDNVIGSQGFEAKMRLLIELRKDPNFNSIRHICIVKGNYLPEEMKTNSIVANFNEWMIFENLNCSVPFELLLKAPIDKKEVLNRAHELRAEGKSYSQISEQLKVEGFEKGSSKSTIHEWLKGK